MENVSKLCLINAISRNMTEQTEYLLLLGKKGDAFGDGIKFVLQFSMMDYENEIEVG